MIAEALRLLRIRRGLTQAAASKLEGAPDVRTLSFWENGRKTPSSGLLRSYLTSLALDFRDFQGALEQVEGTAPKRLRDGLDKLEKRLAEVEQHLGFGADGKAPKKPRTERAEPRGKQHKTRLSPRFIASG